MWLLERSGQDRDRRGYLKMLALKGEVVGGPRQSHELELLVEDWPALRVVRAEAAPKPSSSASAIWSRVSPNRSAPGAMCGLPIRWNVPKRITSRYYARAARRAAGWRRTDGPGGRNAFCS